MTTIGMKQIHWVGKCEADKITSGKYEVPPGEGGTYALVFDNTFSKQFSKTATFVLVVYPTAHPPLLNAQALNPQTAAISIPSAQVVTAPKLSPGLQLDDNGSADSLGRTTSRASLPITNGMDPRRSSSSSGMGAPTFSGVLSKRRRKRHQGYARRFFSLDYTSSTLSYYQNRNSSALRGAIPLSLAAIGANTGTREISIDSGAEIWHLRAANQAEFETWTKALERASKMLIKSRSPNDLKSDSQNLSSHAPIPHDDGDWAEVEGLVGRIAGTRDAVRRLAQNTEHVVPGSASAVTDTGSNASDAGLEEDQKGEGRRPFWKRNASGSNSQSSFFRRSVSGNRLISASPTDGPTLQRSKSKGQLLPLPERAQKSLQHALPFEEDMHGHCKALLYDLDTVVSDFSELLARRKKRNGIVRSATRLSIQSMESQEFFDADDGDDSAFLTIQGDSDVGEDERESSRDDVSSESDDDDLFGEKQMVLADGSLSIFPGKAKSLTPLPCDTVKRRTSIAPPSVMPPSLIGFLRKNVGKDLSTISMPVSANEPISLLQRAAEQFEYSSLLDQAANAADSLERLIYTAAFAVSSLSALRVKERSIRKPFNPMLGETYELIREDRGFRFISEKVSHRPVQIAFQAESAEWSLMQSPLPIQKFWGKSSEIVTEGKARLHLHSSGECLSWTAATCFLRNIIAGEKYIEPVGTMTVTNETTGQKIIITFKSKGMFSGRSEEISAQAIDAHGGELPLGLHGTWTNSLQLTEHGATRPEKTIWAAGSLVDQPAKHYGMTEFAVALNEVTAHEQDKIPPTDSRLRPDQRALEEGQLETAEQLKVVLEERQRTRRKAMEDKGDSWSPRWFTPLKVGSGGEDEVETVWKLKAGKDGYWEERAKGHYTGVENLFKIQ